MEELVVLVDESGNEIGVSEKMDAHLTGKLHRAFSIFIFNDEGEFLIQKRASTKYHSENLWSNTCCSHPRPNESLSDAAHRRLREEMGFDCEMKEIFNFIYYTAFNHELSEHEYDHVFVGEFSGDPQPNVNEVSDWKWIKPTSLVTEIKNKPDLYTYWLKNSFDKVQSLLKNK